MRTERDYKSICAAEAALDIACGSICCGAARYALRGEKKQAYADSSDDLYGNRSENSSARWAGKGRNGKQTIFRKHKSFPRTPRTAFLICGGVADPDAGVGICREFAQIHSKFAPLYKSGQVKGSALVALRRVRNTPTQKRRYFSAFPATP